MASQILAHDGLRRTVADQARARDWTNCFLVPRPWPPGEQAQLARRAFFIAATLVWMPRGTPAVDLSLPSTGRGHLTTDRGRQRV